MLLALKNKLYEILDVPKPYLKPVIYDALMLSLGGCASIFMAYTLGLGILMSTALLVGAGLIASAWTYIKHKQMPWTYFPKYYEEKDNIAFYDKAENNTLTMTEATYCLSKRWYRSGCDFKLGYTQFAIDSVLHFAARHGRWDLVKLFLAYGADPNAPNIVDETPLDIAVKNRQAGLIQLLIDASTPLSSQLFKIAIKNDDLESLTALCQANTKQQVPIPEEDLPISDVISQNNNNIFKYMVEHFNLDINQYLAAPHYMLHCLVSLQNTEGLVYALSKIDGGKIDVKNKSGRTARDLAHLYRFPDIEKLLEDKGGSLTLGERAFGRLRQQQHQSLQEINRVLASFRHDSSTPKDKSEASNRDKRRSRRKHRA